MSMNKYMHPRNVYKSPPNFKQLAIDYPEFRKHVTQDLSGKVSVDFKDIKALRALSCTLLKKDFDLDVEIPLNKLIPTIPLRYNYILWIEDLLSIAPSSGGVRGMDIGTGASCVYPLLAAKKHAWFMLASEIDVESAEAARENVKRNRLENLVSVVTVKGGSLLKEALQGSDEDFDFCMCNPPFFTSSQELFPSFQSRKLSRPKPKNAFCATITEVVAKGGEVDFVSRIINESKELQERIRIYTSMIGQKSSLVPLKALLRAADVTSFKQTEFCQGNTTRWGLAWSFCNVDLRKVPEDTLTAAKRLKPKPPLHYELPPKDERTIDTAASELISIFNKLQMDYKQAKSSKSLQAFTVKAYENTWSNQRRKRREQKRLCPSSTHVVDFNDSEESRSPDSITEDMAGMNVTSCKRELEEDSLDGFYKIKKAKTTNEEQPDVYLETAVIIHNDNGRLLLELQWISGSSDRDVLHQVLQYIKNHLKGVD